MKLAVVTCFFAWAGFKTPERNLRRFLRQMEREGVEVFGAEAVRPGEVSVTGTLPNWTQVQVMPEQELFIKESLLNLAVRERVRGEFGAICWIDADVMFSNPHWRAQTEALLLHHGAVQPFEMARWTDERGKMAKSRPGLIRARPREGRLLHTGHTGFAMAYRREIWERMHGMFPWGVTGSGDALAGAATLGLDYDAEAAGRLPQAPWMTKAWTDWSRGLAREIEQAGGCAYVPGEVVHEFHGGWSGRNYYDRHALLSLAGEVREGPNGIPICAPELARAMVDYWRGRAEDEGEDGEEGIREEGIRE